MINMNVIKMCDKNNNLTLLPTFQKQYTDIQAT